MKRPWPRVTGKMIRVRRLMYWLGARPKPGSIWYSPSMAFVFGLRKDLENQLRAETQRIADRVHPREVGPLLASARGYPDDPRELADKIREDLEALYGPLPAAPADGTRGPQGHWHGGHFYFDCMTHPILPEGGNPVTEPIDQPVDTDTHWANGLPRLLTPEAFDRLSRERDTR